MYRIIDRFANKIVKSDEYKKYDLIYLDPTDVSYKTYHLTGNV